MNNGTVDDLSYQEAQQRAIDTVMQVANECRRKRGEPPLTDMEHRRPQYSKSGHSATVEQSEVASPKQR